MRFSRTKNKVKIRRNLIAKVVVTSILKAVDQEIVGYYNAGRTILQVVLCTNCSYFIITNQVEVRSSHFGSIDHCWRFPVINKQRISK